MTEILLDTERKEEQSYSVLSKEGVGGPRGRLV